MRQCDNRLPPVCVDPGGCVRHNPYPPGGARNRGHQLLAQILPIGKARHEAVSLLPIRKAHPSDKVPRIVGECTHVGSAHIEQVFWPPCAECEALADRRIASFD